MSEVCQLLEKALLLKGLKVEKCGAYGVYKKTLRFRFTHDNSICYDWPYPDLMKAYCAEFYGK